MELATEVFFTIIRTGVCIRILHRTIQDLTTMSQIECNRPACLPLSGVVRSDIRFSHNMQLSIMLIAILILVVLYPPIELRIEAVFVYIVVLSSCVLEDYLVR